MMTLTHTKVSPQYIYKSSHFRVSNFYNHIMSEPLYSQVKELLQQNDQQSIKYILSDQPNEVIEGICSKLSEKEAAIVKRIHLQLQGEAKGVLIEDQLQVEIRNKKMQKFLQQGDEKKGDGFLELLARAHEKLRYMEEYGFPYYDLFKRIITTHGDLHPSMQTIKTLHSQVQIMLTVLFKQQILSQIEQRMETMQNGMKSYLHFIFPTQSEKFRNAQSIYRNIKKSTKQVQSSDEEDSQACQQIPLSQDQTLLLDEKQFLASLAQSVAFSEFQQFCRNREYNFMCFGIKKFEDFIGIPSQLYTKIKEKDFCELVSFLTVRFVRKILFTIIRQRGKGKLLPLTKCLTSQEITGVGNELIDQISLKIDEFRAPVKSNQQEAASLFKTQFQLMNYEDFVPKRYITQAQSKQVSTAQYVWQQNKQYKTLWLQRVKAEKYINQGEKGSKPNIEYINHIKTNLPAYKSNSASLWKSFIMYKMGYGNNLKNAPSKRSKLQSLKD